MRGFLHRSHSDKRLSPSRTKVISRSSSADSSTSGNVQSSGVSSGHRGGEPAAVPTPRALRDMPVKTVVGHSLAPRSHNYHHGSPTSPVARARSASLSSANSAGSRSSGSRSSTRSGSSSGSSGSSSSASSLSVVVSPRSNPQVNSHGFDDFCVADIALAETGRREVEFAEPEMPGLMQLRTSLGKDKPLSGARIVGCLHVTVQTVVLIETLLELGAEVRWSSCNMYSTQDHAAAALAEANVPVFAWKGETEEQFWWCIERAVVQSGWVPNMLLDDGGDLTAFLHERHPNMLTQIRGITEDTATGVHRLYQMWRSSRLKVPGFNVNNSVTKSKFDNLYGCRESVVDAIKRATDLTISGKTVVVAGFGDVGKGVSQALRSARATVLICEIDPICALQACMEGYSVVSMDKAAKVGDIFVTATGNKSVITRAHMESMKSNAILCNIGHFDAEIDVESLATDDVIWTPVKPLVDRITFPNGSSIILLGEGRLVNLTCSTGHPSFIMSITFTNTILAQIELYRARVGQYKPEVYHLPKHLDEEVARLHLSKFSAELTRLTPEQAAYVGLDPAGPYKNADYRY